MYWNSTVFNFWKEHEGIRAFLIIPIVMMIYITMGPQSPPPRLIPFCTVFSFLLAWEFAACLLLATIIKDEGTFEKECKEKAIVKLYRSCDLVSYSCKTGSFYDPKMEEYKHFCADGVCWHPFLIEYYRIQEKILVPIEWVDRRFGSFLIPTIEKEARKELRIVASQRNKADMCPPPPPEGSLGMFRKMASKRST